MPLLAVEQGIGDRFELERDDADVVVRVPGGAPLWQKERLLTIGIRALPRACELVAWLDGDIVFERGDWVDDARAALERLEMVHLFHERHDLPRLGLHDDPLDAARAWSGSATAESVVHRIATGMPIQHIAESAGIDRFRSTCGLAWAHRHRGATG